MENIEKEHLLSQVLFSVCRKSFTEFAAAARFPRTAFFVAPQGRLSTARIPRTRRGGYQPPGFSRRECIHAFRMTHPVRGTDKSVPYGLDALRSSHRGLVTTETPIASCRGRRPRLPGYRVTDSPGPGYNGRTPPPGGPGGPPLRTGRTAFLSPGPRHNRNTRRLS